MTRNDMSAPPLQGVPRKRPRCQRRGRCFSDSRVNDLQRVCLSPGVEAAGYIRGNRKRAARITSNTSEANR